MTIIRIATEADVDILCRLHGYLNSHHDAIDPFYAAISQAPEEYKKDLVDKLSSPKFHIFIADADGVAAGYIIMQIKLPTVGHLWEMFVSDSYRKQGIGQQLFESAVVWLKENNVTAIELSVDSRNEVGIAVWEKFGFREYQKRMKLQI